MTTKPASSHSIELVRRGLSWFSTTLLLGVPICCGVACSAEGDPGNGDGDSNQPDGSTGGTGGVGDTATGGTGGLGDGATGGVGATATGGIEGTGASGSGGDMPVANDPDQAALDAGETCIYGYLTLEIDAGEDANTQASFASSISQSMYDASSGTRFTTDADNGTHLVISWQPPVERPDFVDFNASISYPSEGGSLRHLCISGRLLDAYQYPVEPYYTFFATSVFEANADGSCTATAVTARVSGCLSENYNL